MLENKEHLPTDVEVTPEMLSAGMDAYWEWENDPKRFCCEGRLGYLASAIYVAMMHAKSSCTPSKAA